MTKYASRDVFYLTTMSGAPGWAHLDNSNQIMDISYFMAPILGRYL